MTKPTIIIKIDGGVVQEVTHNIPDLEVDVYQYIEELSNFKPNLTERLSNQLNQI